MTRLTAGQLITVRSPSQSTELYLGIYRPPTVFTANITTGTAVGKGSTLIPYNNASGSYLDVKYGMTMYIGTTPNGTDVGRIRVRKINTGTITVAPDDNIIYVTGQYLTVKSFYELWSVYPQVTVDANNNVTFYKDGDIPYIITGAAQNINFQPVPIMGPNHIGFVGPYGSGSVYFTATGSYPIESASIASYNWKFPTGCSIQSSTQGTPGYVSFPSPGNYTVDLDVITSNGQTGTAHRHVTLLDRPGTGPNTPIFEWTLNDLSGDWENGWTATITVDKRADEFKDGDLVYIFADDYYNNVLGSYGGYPGREHIVFVGYVSHANTISDFTDASHTKLNLRGTSNLFRNKEMFSISLEDNGAPGDWTRIRNMTINKAINHYLRWHTTLLNIADYTHILSTGGFYPVQYIDVRKGEILGNIKQLLRGSLFANFCGDKQGSCFSEVDLNMLPTGSRPSSAMTIQDTDWLDTFDYDEMIDVPVSNVTLGGVAYEFSTYSGTALLSRAPGDDVGYVGKTENVSGLVLLSQNQLNELAGLYLAKSNIRIPLIPFELANNMRNIDIVPQELYDFRLLSTDTYRKTIINSRLIPRKVSYKYHKNKLIASVDFEPETSGPPGDTVIIPVDPPEGQLFNSGVNLYPTSPEIPGPVITAGDGSLVYVATQTTLARSRNFGQAGLTHWENIIGVLAGKSFTDFILDPWNPKNKAWCTTTDGIYKTDNLDDLIPNWILMKSLPVGYVGFYRIHANITVQNLFFALASDGLVTSNVVVLHTHDGGNNWTTVNTGVNGEFARPVGFDVSDHNSTTVMTGASAGRILRSTDGGHSFSVAYAGTAGEFYSPHDIYIPYESNPTDQIVFWGGQAVHSNIFKTTNGFASATDISSNQNHSGAITDGISGDDAQMQPAHRGITGYTQNTLQIAILGQAYPDVIEPPHFMISYDGGITWTTRHTFASHVNILGGFPYNNNRMYCIGVVTGEYLLISDDGGTTWIDQLGDWITVFGSAPTAAGVKAVMIVPVWTA